MPGNRKRYSAEFRAKVVLEAIRGELTVSQLVANHGVHQTPVCSAAISKRSAAGWWHSSVKLAMAL